MNMYTYTHRHKQTDTQTDRHTHTWAIPGCRAERAWKTHRDTVVVCRACWEWSKATQYECEQSRVLHTRTFLCITVFMILNNLKAKCLSPRFLQSPCKRTTKN